MHLHDAFYLAQFLCLAFVLPLFLSYILAFYFAYIASCPASVGMHCQEFLPTIALHGRGCNVEKTALVVITNPGVQSLVSTIAHKMIKICGGCICRERERVLQAVISSSGLKFTTLQLCNEATMRTTLHTTLYTLHFTLHTLYSTLYTPQSTPYTLYTLLSSLHTSHSTLYT